MARIAESEIERLKLEISVERLAVAKGIALARHGKDLMGRCPFHDDRTPSLVITPEKNLWHCLGACQTGGSVIDWVMKAEGLSFRHAVELLRADLPSLAAFSATKMGRQTTPVAKKTTTPKMATVLEPSESDDVLMKRVVAFYHSTLKASPEALEYLSRRGLQSAEMLERFQIGFANRTLSYRLPSKNRQTGAELRGQLEKLGLYRESGHEHFNGSIVIPVMDEAGRVTEMYGRKITARLRPGTPNHLYLAGPHRGVWNVEALAASKTIILCEALIDALTFWCAGFRNVTSSYGVEGFTDDHVAAFKKHGTEKVLIAYDRDDAGDQAAEKLSTKLMEMGIECSRVRFPRGMDANEYAQKVTPAAQSLAVVLRQAEWMGKGKRAAPAEMLAAENESAATGATTMEIESDGKILVVSKDGEVLEERDAEGPGFATKEASPELEDRERIPSLVAEQPLATKADAASADEVSFRFGDRKWRVRGLGKNASSAVLKVNVLVARDNGGFHVDALELYSARQRAAYVTLAAAELGVEERVVKK